MNNLSSLADKIEEQSKLLTERSNEFVKQGLERLAADLRKAAEVGQKQIASDTELHHQFLKEVAQESRKANKAEMAATITLQRKARALQKAEMQQTLAEQKALQAQLRKAFWVPAIGAVVAMSVLLLLLAAANLYLGKLLIFG